MCPHFCESIFSNPFNRRCDGFYVIYPIFTFYLNMSFSWSNKMTRYRVIILRFKSHQKIVLGTLSKRPEISKSGLTGTLTYWHSFWIFYLRYPIMTMVKSSKFQALRRYAVECCTKPYATIFMIHSEVKITKNIYSTFSWKRKKKRQY